MTPLIKGPHGGNARNQKTTFPHVVARQERAKARQAEADKRTPEEQLKRLDAAGLASPKERAKLLKRIEERNKPKPPAPVKTEQAKLTKEERRALRQRGTHKITAEDAEKLKGIPVQLPKLVDVEIGK